LDLIRFIGDGPTSGTLYRHTNDKIAHRGGDNPQLMLSAISLIEPGRSHGDTHSGSHIGQKSASEKSQGSERLTDSQSS
jgi:hypothetical protein